MIWISAMALVINVKVIPRAGRLQWVLDKSGQLKCYVKSPPEKNKANKELIQGIAQSLGIPQDLIMIITGKTGRKKRVKIDVEMTYNMFLDAMGLEWQMDMF